MSTTNSEGAGKWRNELSQHLRDRHVVLLPDNDDAGHKHARQVAQSLRRRASSVKVLELPNLPAKGDVSDWLDAGGTAEELERLVRETPERGQTNTTKKAEPVGVALSDIVPERVEWLWPRRIPYGKITVLDGDPDNGKSVLTTDLCARISAGLPLPDGTPTEAAGVVILSAEDGPADTIRPRFDAAGGEPSNVRLLGVVPEGEDGERIFSVPEDIPLLEECIRQIGASLVVMDPLMAFLSSEVNANRDGDVRRALAPLARMAERTGTAVVIVRHLNKAVGMNALYRGGGSIGIIGAARSGLVVGKHPDDESLRVLAGQKNNLSPPPESLAYRIEAAANGAARIVYEGTTETSAGQLLKAPVDDEERSALSEAKEFLRDELGDGPMAAKQVKKDARDADIAERTLKRAKAALGVRSEKEADGSWTWSLPPKDAKGGHTPTDGPVGPLEKDGPLEEEDSAYLSEGGQGGKARGARDPWPPSKNGNRIADSEDWRDHPLDCECDECLYGLEAGGVS